MKTKYSVILIQLLAANFLFSSGCTKSDNSNTVPKEDDYIKLRRIVQEDQSQFYQDFKGASVTPVSGSSDQFQIGTATWWVPNWMSTPHPVLADSCLLLTSTKAPGQTSTKNEIQSNNGFTIGANGEFIVGYRSTRWKKGYTADANWADSSIGLELFGTPHQAIVFTYGSLGVFADPTGQCPDNSCMYNHALGWPTTNAVAGEFIGIRITWVTEPDNSRTFHLYYNDDTIPKATLSNINYSLNNLRIRFNANVTDTDKLPTTDSDSLYINYVSVKDHVMSNSKFK